MIKIRKTGSSLLHTIKQECIDSPASAPSSQPIQPDEEPLMSLNLTEHPSGDYRVRIGEFPRYCCEAGCSRQLDPGEDRDSDAAQSEHDCNRLR